MFTDLNPDPRPRARGSAGRAASISAISTRSTARTTGMSSPCGLSAFDRSRDTPPPERFRRSAVVTRLVSAPTSRTPRFPIHSRAVRIGYARVSTRDQHPERPSRRPRRRLRTDLHRHRVREARAAARARRGAAYAAGGSRLVVTRLDRLGRSLEHLIDLSNELQTGEVDLMVLDQGIDTSTAVGRMFFRILGAIAEFEHALMSERTSDGLEAARARGRTGGQKPKLGVRQARLAREMSRPGSSPSPRSPPSSASPAPPSTATSTDWTEHEVERVRAGRRAEDRAE